MGAAHGGAVSREGDYPLTVIRVAQHHEGRARALGLDLVLRLGCEARCMG